MGHIFISSLTPFTLLIFLSWLHVCSTIIQEMKQRRFEQKMEQMERQKKEGERLIKEKIDRKEMEREKSFQSKYQHVLVRIHTCINRITKEIRTECLWFSR